MMKDGEARERISLAFRLTGFCVPNERGAVHHSQKEKEKNSARLCKATGASHVAPF